MDKEEKYIRSIAGKGFSDEEYRMLRNEQNLRLEMINSHGFTIISLAFVFFSAILVFVGKIFELAAIEHSVLGKSIWIDSVVILTISAFCLLPIFLISCLSVKYEDALIQIISVAVYCKVFYEFPSMIRNESKNTKKILAWELFHCNSSAVNSRQFASEYFLISLATIILSFIVTLTLLCCAYTTNGYFQENTVNSVVALCVFTILYGLSIAFSIYIAIKTRKNTQTNELIAKYGGNYLEQYINIAKDSEFLTSDEINEFNRLIKAMQERDKNQTSRKKGFYD